MKHAIKTLEESLFSLDYSYKEYVINGNVDISSEVALDNRSKAKSFEKSIKILKASDETPKVIANESEKEICSCGGSSYEPYIDKNNKKRCFECDKLILAN